MAMLQQPASWMPWWALLLALAVALTAAVEFDALPDEADAVREVQGWAFPGETVSDAVRWVTSTEFVVIAGIPIVALHWLSGGRRAAVLLTALLVVMPVAQAGIKELVDRPRPSEAVSGVEVRSTQTSPSFPSGHVMGATVVYGWAIVMLLDGRHRGRPARRAGPHGRTGGAGQDDAEVRRAPATADSASLVGAGVLVIVLVLTSLVSVYLGVHWPSDVAGGYLWGAALLLPALAAR